jgi:signal peptidase I
VSPAKASAQTAATVSGGGAGATPAPRAKGIVRDYFETIVICVIFVIFSRAFVFQQSKIPTGSMEDTLLIGDYIMVNRFAYAPAPSDLERSVLPVREISRHDIIVFKYPLDPDVDYIKRVVALPGENVEVRAGKVLVNDEFIDEPFLKPEYMDQHSFWGPKVVPKDSFFVLGDHRNNSKDSRYWGFVPRSYIKGRAFVIWFSYNESPGDWQKTGLARIRSIINKIFHFITETRWSRCFSLIR